MAEIDHITLPAFRYFVGESEKICRLCFSDTDNGVLLSESRLIQCQYFDGTITYEDMLIDLGAAVEPSLPKMLCEPCADIAINSFLFRKLCHESYKKWQENLEKFNKTLDFSDTLDPAVKTAYLLIKNEGNRILTSHRKQRKKNKEVALKKIQYLLKARNNCQIVRKKSDFMCEECGKKFPSPSILTKHMTVHSNIKYNCPECLKQFSSLVLLQAHTERSHIAKTIQCPKCADMFSTEKMLKQHDSNYHTDVQCKLCSKLLPSRKVLRQHLDKHDIHKCPHCLKEFISKCSFKIHIKICGTEEAKHLKFFCDLCGNGYVFRNGLIGHLRTSHGFGHTYSCNWCKKPFDAISRLKSHIVKHTRERNFHCEQCGGQFVTQAALVYHIRIHTGEKPYPCDLCDKSFLSTSRRMEHKRRKHLGPNRECNVCHRMFVTTHEMKKHMVRHKNPTSKLFVAKD